MFSCFLYLPYRCQQRLRLREQRAKSTNAPANEIAHLSLNERLLRKVMETDKIVFFSLIIIKRLPLV